MKTRSKFSLVVLAFVCGGIVSVQASNLLNGFDSNVFPVNDDGSIEVDFGFDVNFFGLTGGANGVSDDVWLNNNGNVTFGDDFGGYTPENLATATDVPAMLAAFWADVETEVYGEPVRYGTGTFMGRQAWCATF